MALQRKGSVLSVPDIIIGGPDRAGESIKSTIVDNGAQIQVGDVLSVTTESTGNGIVVRRYNGSGDPILGICVGLRNGNGSQPTFDSGVIPNRLTVASDNETVAQVYAEVDITPGAKWSAPLSAAIHTTLAFGAGRFIDPDTGANAGRLLESSITATAGTNTRGFSCWGPDPDNTTRGLVIVAESIFNGLITATS